MQIHLKQFGVFFLTTVTVFFLVVFISQWINSGSIEDAFFLITLLFQNIWQPMALIVFSIPYLIFHLLRYYNLLFKNHGVEGFIRKFGMYTVLPLFLLGGTFSLIWKDHRTENFHYNWDRTVENLEGFTKARFEDDQKIRGVHYFSPWRGETEHNLEVLVQNNVEYIVLVPYCYQESHDKPELRFRNRRRGSVERIDSTYRRLAAEALRLGLQTIIKPHVWMQADQGFWRSDIDFKSQAEFDVWASQYMDFILHFAKISEEIQAPYFCIGAELSELSKGYPDYWKMLIKEVRKVYGGKLFYAANWHDEYEHIQFWDELDLIGVQAYFPICPEPNPTVDNLKAGWRPHLTQIKRFSRRIGKPILFSEIGYKSTDDAADTPWEWVDGAHGLTKRLSTETQANCYQAFFEMFWQESWFNGALIWQWRAHHDRAGGDSNIDFTPQNKPAQNVMAKWFGRE
ncbi:MAG: hypothetical protein OEQ53_11335 [Saprospiraceae bacterium]|nr:hypothetical protein [Saprospiraceae bacterium]